MTAGLTKPTRAIRRFLAKLASSPNGSRTRREMGSPAYPMTWRMERAGWIKCTFPRDAKGLGRYCHQLWCTPETYRITAAGRKAIANGSKEKARTA